ncbi:hypothetical protein LDENG_00299480, partial [Lucifuga dentata]
VFYRFSTGLFIVTTTLYILYTNDCRSKYQNRHILKFADDTVIISLLHGKEDSHGPVLNDFVQWCDDNFLTLNISKTKDVFIDFRRASFLLTPPQTLLNGQAVQSVKTYKYLGTIIDDKLNIDGNTDLICKKG